MDYNTDNSLDQNDDPLDDLGRYQSWETEQYESEISQVEYSEQPEEVTAGLATDSQYTSDSASDTFNVELFLKLVCNYPYLYDSQKQDYSNRLMKERAWDSIAQSMCTSIEFCKAKWKSLREKYNREKQKADLASRSGAAANFTSPWEYMSFFKYMFDSSKPRATTSSFHTSSKGSNMAQDRAPDNMSMGNQSNIFKKKTLRSTQVSNTIDETLPKSPLSTLKPHLKQKTYKRKEMESPSEPTLTVLRQISSSIENVSKPVQPEDKIHAYTHYVAAELRDLPKSVQEEFMDSTVIKLLQLKRKK